MPKLQFQQDRVTNSLAIKEKKRKIDVNNKFTHPL